MKSGLQPSSRNLPGRLAKPRATKPPRSVCWRKRAGLYGGLLACFLPSLAAGQGLRPPAPNASQNRHWQQIQWFYNQRAYPLGYIPAGARLKALDQLQQMLTQEGKGHKNSIPAHSRAAGSPAATSAELHPASGASQRLAGATMTILPSTTQWTLIGPEPTDTQNGNPYLGGPATSGRVTALAVDPGNSSIVYLGGAQGGVWKTTDGGAHWAELTDSQPSLAVGSIALDPSNSSIVYLGTGEENFAIDSYYGAGILKSTDGGATWTQLGASDFAGPFSSCNTCGGAFIGSLAVDPSNGQVVLAAVEFASHSRYGIFRSTDGGSTWTNVLAGGSGTAAFFDPTNGNIAYAAIYGGSVYKSANGGATWARADAGGTNKLPTSNVGRIALALAPSSTTTLYAGVANSSDGSLLGLYKSTDGGVNWSQVTSIPDYCTQQCWYDNVIAVDPANANAVFAAGTDDYGQAGSIFRSLDGGTTWAAIDKGANGVNLHTDMHVIAFGSAGSKLYVGNDGGSWSTTDVTNASVNWTSLNSTLAITQFYPGVSTDPTTSNTAFGGTQDNGTQAYSGSLAWDYVLCGDGGWNAVDTATPTTVYGACAGFVGVFKSTSSGSLGSWVERDAGITNSDRASWVPPLVMDPSNHLALYFGTYRVYQTTNAAGLWSVISGDLTAGGTITTIAVAPSDSNTVYVGTSDPKVQVTANAGAGASATWTDRTAGLPPRYVTQIAVDPATATTAYVTFSGFSGFGGDTQGHVFKTTNGGASWTDISGNLPNIPVNDIVVDPDIASTLYVGTDIGVFGTSNGGATWFTMVTGLPRVAVLSLKLHRPSRTLRAASHGRSVWDLSVPSKKKRGQIISQ